MSSILPPEILLQIFGYDSYIHTLFDFGLSYEEQEELRLCSLVNRSWRLVAQSLLFRFISARVNDYRKSYEKLYVSIEGTDWGKEVVVLNIHYEYSSEEVFDTNRLVQEFPNLKELALWNCKLVNLDKLSKLQYLQSLQMDCCSMIISSPSVFKSLINLSFYRTDNKLAFSKLLQSMPFLQALSLYEVDISLKEFNQSLVKPLKALLIETELLSSWNIELQLDDLELVTSKLSKLKLLNITHDELYDAKNWLERKKDLELYLLYFSKELEMLQLFYWTSEWGIRHRINRNYNFNCLKKLMYIAPTQKQYYIESDYDPTSDDVGIDFGEIRIEQATIGLEKGYQVEWLPNDGIDPRDTFWKTVESMKL